MLTLSKSRVPAVGNRFAGPLQEGSSTFWSDAATGRGPAVSRASIPRNRESIKEDILNGQTRSRWKVFGLACMVVLALVAAAVSLMKSGLASPSGATRGSLYFTTDDGASLFSAPAAQAPSFGIDGKIAVRAAVFSCDNNATHFIGYVERQNPKYAASLGAQPVDAKNGDAYGAAARIEASYEVKRVGDSRWVPLRSREGGVILNVRSPDGKGRPLEVTP